jgi:O-antigen ligase
MGVFASIRYFSHPKLVKWRLTGLVTAVGLGSLVLVSIAGPDLPSLSTQRFSLFADFLSRGASGDLNTAVGDTSSGERVQLFGLAITLFETHPVLGVGPEGFDVLSPHYLSPIEADVYPHNAILQFAAEYGLVGLALFLVLVGLAVTRKLPRLTSITAIRVLFAFAFLNAMVSGNVFNDRELWGYLMLLALIDVRRITPADTPELGRPAAISR